MLFSQINWPNKIYDHGDTTIFGTSSGWFARGPLPNNRRLKKKVPQLFGFWAKRSQRAAELFFCHFLGNVWSLKNSLYMWTCMEFMRWTPRVMERQPKHGFKKNVREIRKVGQFSWSLLWSIYFSLRFSENRSWSWRRTSIFVGASTVAFEKIEWQTQVNGDILFFRKTFFGLCFQTQFVLKVGWCSFLYHISDSEGLQRHGTRKLSEAWQLFGIVMIHDVGVFMKKT